MNECLTTPQHKKSVVGCQTNGIYIKKLKSNMYVLKIHKVINTVQRDLLIDKMRILFHNRIHPNIFTGISLKYSSFGKT